MAKVKLDKHGIILPLAIAAVFAIGMFVYFNGGMGKVASDSIKTFEELDEVLGEVDSQNPNVMKTDLDANAVDASNF